MTRSEILKRLSTSGVAHLANEIGRRIESSIRMRARDVRFDHLPLGASRLGGVPDVPAGFDWPRAGGEPLQLIAQLNLRELKLLDATGVLPRTGWLCFFYDVDGPAWGFDPSERGCWRVIYLDCDLGALERIRPSERHAVSGDKVCALDFEHEWTLPDATTLQADGLLESLGADWHAYCDVVLELREESQGIHRLLGQPDIVQADMRLECQLASNGVYCGNESGYRDLRRAALEAGAADWTLLLQVDTDAQLGWMWGDSGRIYYWIRKQDLAAKDFDQVWFVLQCG